MANARHAIKNLKTDFRVISIVLSYKPIKNILPYPFDTMEKIVEKESVYHKETAFTEFTFLQFSLCFFPALNAQVQTFERAVV